MLYDSATNQNLCMSSEIKRPALLSTYWPIKISGHQDHVKMIKLISFCREKNATKAQQDLELCCPSAPFVGLHGTLQMHDGTDGVGPLFLRQKCFGNGATAMWTTRGRAPPKFCRRDWRSA
mmetsp:Transcript_65865/g.133797  ORF Transcript_65865/g.133797 Transcript_65865/m.133797 type:complete len:121 (+) Transcript_65865:3-365(+)